MDKCHPIIRSYSLDLLLIPYLVNLCLFVTIYTTMHRGELQQAGKHKHEAGDDVNVHRCGVGDLGRGFATVQEVSHGKNSNDTEGDSGGCRRGVNPEGHPAKKHHKGDGKVEAIQIEHDAPLQIEHSLRLGVSSYSGVEVRNVKVRLHQNWNLLQELESRDRGLPAQPISIRKAQSRKKTTNLCAPRGLLKKCVYHI